MDHVNSMPRYAKSFACSGSACPDTCCSGWNVHIDSTTLATWQTITLAKAGPALVHFTRAPKPQDVKMTDHPAVITRKPDGTCPLMTREKLCSVHARHGDEALPLVCHTFPRGLVKSGHEVSLFMSLGCPEAARLALADPTALDMVIAEQLPTGRLPPVGRHDSPGLATPEELADSSVDGVRASAAVFLNAARRLIRDPRLTVWQAWGLYWHKAIETWLALKSAPRTAAAGKLNELRDLADMGQHLLPMARASPVSSRTSAATPPPRSRMPSAQSLPP